MAAETSRLMMDASGIEAGPAPIGPRLRVPGAGVQPSLLRVIGWCVAVLMIASALLPLVPRFGGTRAALTLEVSGALERISAEEVRNAIAGQLNADFYELDLNRVKTAVEALPWVAHARVTRAWPAAVRVHVWEHRAVARWGAGSLLSSEDVVFTPKAIDADLSRLPKLDGPVGQQTVVRKAFEALRTQLADTPFVPAALVQSLRGEWTAVTADGIELRLGRGAPTDVVGVLAGPARTALEGRLQEVTYVDLHYFNGFAVGWRQQQRQGDARSSGAKGTGG